MATCVPQHLQSGRLTHPPVILRCAATGNQDSRDPSWLDDLPSEATPPLSHVFRFPSQTGPSHREAYLPAALLESGEDTRRSQSGAGQAGVSADAAACLNLDSVLFNFRSHALSESCGFFVDVFGVYCSCMIAGLYLAVTVLSQFTRFVIYPASPGC